MKLADVERRFYELVTGRPSVAETLAARGPAARRAVDEMVIGDARLSSVGRLEIYATMYFVRIHDVLRDEYPKTAVALGAEAFHALVTDYLDAHRPSHPSLREAGARLPAFLSEHEASARRPWLAELARLERTRFELGDGPDADALSMAALRARPPETFGALRLRLVPCHALLENRHDVAALWRADEPSIAPEATPTTLLVWRHDLDVLHRAVDREEAAWLRRLEVSEVTFEALCAALGAGRSDETAAARAFELCGRWASDGLLRTDG